MVKLSFVYMTLDLNIFNLQKQPNGFDIVDQSTLSQTGDFSYDDLEFEHVDKLPIEYESFLMNNKSEYDAFDFDDIGPVDFIADVVYSCDSFTVSLDLKCYLTPLSVLFKVLISLT